MIDKNIDNLTDLQKIQMVELGILIEFDKICRENNFTYFLDSGTALGAARHQGFIPWDDDVDVCMPRNDYDRFMEVGQELLGEDYFLQNRKTDPNSPFSFAKIRKNGTTFLEWNKRNIKMHHGIFIDIFPLDILPEDFEGRAEYIEKCHKLNQKLIKRMIPDRAKIPEKNIKWLIGAVARRLQYYIGHISPVNKIDEEIEREFSRYIDRGFTGNDCTLHPYAGSYVFSSKTFFPPKEIVFEGHKFFCPSDMDTYLTILYGNYMKLPPEETWVGHRPKCISYDKELFVR